MTEAALLPQPSPVSLDPSTSAVLVLDLTEGAAVRSPAHRQFIDDVGEFLERARNDSVPIIFTGMTSSPSAPAYPSLKRRDSEPLLVPDGFDKFVAPELNVLLEQHFVKNLVTTGASANVAIMYTATRAARNFGFQVYIPVDGVFTEDRYRYEYALYQLSVLPPSAIQPRFTTLHGITFGNAGSLS